jgi:hypothetical protein
MTPTKATDGLTPRRSMNKFFRYSSIIVLLLFGCLNLALNASQRMGFMIQAPMALPPGAYDIEQLGKGWHTFRLKLGGKDHLFLRRLYSNEESTESLSEINDTAPE